MKRTLAVLALLTLGCGTAHAVSEGYPKLTQLRFGSWANDSTFIAISDTASALTTLVAKDTTEAFSLDEICSWCLPANTLSTGGGMFKVFITADHASGVDTLYVAADLVGDWTATASVIPHANKERWEMVADDGAVFQAIVPLSTSQRGYVWSPTFTPGTLDGSGLTGTNVGLAANPWGKQKIRFRVMTDNTSAAVLFGVRVYIAYIAEGGE